MQNGNRDIRNIYCVGRNYRQHAAELGNAVPDSPMIFMKPSHALAETGGGRLLLPGGIGEIHYETELVLHIAYDYEPGARVEELVDAFALGIDFTLRDVQTGLKQKGHPWLPAKGFRNSAPLTAFQPATDWTSLLSTPFSLELNGREVQRGAASEMIYNPQQLIDFIGVHYGLGAGDILFTGTPAGVGPVADGDLMQLLWNGELQGQLHVAIQV